MKSYRSLGSTFGWRLLFWFTQERGEKWKDEQTTQADYQTQNRQQPCGDKHIGITPHNFTREESAARLQNEPRRFGLL